MPVLITPCPFPEPSKQDKGFRVVLTHVIEERVKGGMSAFLGKLAAGDTDACWGIWSRCVQEGCCDAHAIDPEERHRYRGRGRCDWRRRILKRGRGATLIRSPRLFTCH